MVNMFRIPVIRLLEGNVPAYIGKMKATEILKICNIERFREDSFKGYQREPQQKRLRQIAEYIKECPIPVMPAILIGLSREFKFIQLTTIDDGSDFGFLEIPNRYGVITLIDGQHRILGFQLLLKELEESKSLGYFTHEEEELLSPVLNYEIPVLFVDTQTAAKLVNENKSPESIVKAQPEHVELMIFYILNRTQKGIRPSLKDTLQYVLWSAGIKGIPAMEEWRAKAAYLGILLARKEDSPLCGKINISGTSGLGKPTQLASFVSSLEELLTNTDFKDENPMSQFEFLKAYWEAIRSLFPTAFGPHWRRFVILKAIGIYSLNLLAADVYRWCKEKTERPTMEDILVFIKPLKTFEWNRIELFSGLKGVREAYKMLLKHLAENNVINASKRLEEKFKPIGSV